MTDPRRMHLVDAATGGASPTRTLSEINFNDIYFRPGQPPRVRDPDPSFGEAKGRLEAVPRSFYEDAQALLAATVSESRARGNAAEFNVQHGGVSYRAARVSFGQESHEGWCLRRLAPAPPALNRLGLPVDLALALDGLAHESGLLIISGSFSSGKSTTASSVFSHWLQRYGDVGVTLEDPIETSIPQPPDSDGLCYQVEVEGEGFAEAIKAARRWAPRYIYIGEIRTPEAAAELLQIAIGGPIVITTVQADNLISAVASLAKWAAQAIGDDPARQMLANALRLVVHQTLIRRRPSIEWINLPAGDKTAARAKIRTGRFDQLVDEVDLQHFQRNARNG